MDAIDITWLVVALVSGAAEAVVPGMITVWFVAGALVAFVAGHLGAPLALQIVVFLVVSLSCLVLFRPLIMKSRKKGERIDASSSLMGQKAVVVQEAGEGFDLARVRLSNNMGWAALSCDGSPLKMGDRVVVCGQESVKLIVKRLDSESERKEEK